MSKYLSILSRKVGQPPGSLLHVGVKSDEESRVEIMLFDKDSIFEESIEVDQINEKTLDKSMTYWINFYGVHDIQKVEQIGKYFGLHSLTLEDIVNTEHRPKFENNEHYLFLILKMLQYGPDKKQVSSEQLSIILFENLVISFQEKSGDVFNPVRERIRNKSGRIRSRGADYLFYALIDIVVDNYIIIFENVEDDIQELEEDLFSNPDEDDLLKIQNIKKNIISLRKSIIPLKEAFITIMNSESSIIKKETRRFLKDVFDHISYLTERIDSYKDIITGLKDIYLSSISVKMNNIMKVLTIIATIFIPLTFIAGIYGMNFDYMPELRWQWGYFAILGVMFIAIVIMLFFFKRKKWF